MSGIVWPNGSKTIPRVSSEFNPARRHPITGAIQPHNGIDLVGFVWNVAPEDGLVTLAGYNGGAGIEVRIVADGATAFRRGTTYRIHHNAPNSLRVKAGDRVTAGQIVARQGTTGQSTGVHTHFETHPGASWNPVNPRDYMRSALAAPASGGAQPVPSTKELKVKTYHYEDANAKRPVGRVLAPGGGGYLHTTAGVEASKATNVVGGIGPYSITPHIYAEGAPGDAVDLALLWDDTKTGGPHSPSYTERLVIGPDGKLFASREFKRAVASGYAVYLRVLTPSTNKAPVKVTRLDVDAYLFVVA